MKTWFTVRDNITNENIIFDDYVQALEEAESRLALHKNGYKARRNWIQGVDAVLIENGHDLIICVRPEVTECKK